MKIDLPAPIVGLHAAGLNPPSGLLAREARTGAGGGLGARQPERRSGPVLPAESQPQPAPGDGAAARDREVARLRQRTLSLEGELAHRQRLEGVLRGALAERAGVEEALRDRQRELVSFFESALEGFRWIGPDGRIMAANRAELELLGYAREEYVGHNVLEFHVDRAEVTDVLERMRRNEPPVRDRETQLRCRDGSVKTVLVHYVASPRNGELLHTCCITRDVTERRRLEGHLLRQNEDLARTVRFGELFVGILGHDLRNPLSAITTAASLIKRRADSDRLGAPASRILNSAGRMERMIDQLLDFARIRLGTGIEVEPQAIDLAALIREAVDDLASSGGAWNVEVACVGDLTGRWDRARVLQLVSNLLADAAAPTVAPGTISIEADGTQPEWVTLVVRNPEVLSREELPALFEPFRGGGAPEHPERSPGLGLGLGLFMSQQIVLAHGGSIHAESSEALGTRIAIVLPRESASGGGSASASPGAPGLGRGREVQ
jgi:PAS domain S-box-containing protein